VLYDQGKKNASRDVLQPLLTKGLDTMNYYFMMGLWATKAGMTDSSIYWYRKCYAFEPSVESVCLNNIGHKMIVKGEYDSARVLFKRVIEIDSTSPFPYFNLGCIDERERNYSSAIDWFIKSIETNTANPTGYLSGMSIYYGKKYKDNNSKAFKSFDGKMRTFKLEYLSYLAVLYIYFRATDMVKMEDNIRMIFQQLYRFKQHDAATWYHYACYRSLLNDSAGALTAIEEALKLGFGDSFALQNDMDLEAVRTSPAFSALIKQYFK
jgi:tetratricopeptide (TPR) repeat protein